MLKCTSNTTQERFASRCETANAGEQQREEDIKRENKGHVIILQHKTSPDSTVNIPHFSKWIV